MNQLAESRPPSSRRKAGLPIRVLLALTLSGLASVAATTVTADAPTPSATVVPRWQARVDRYLRQDRTAPPPMNGIVFTGSSSIEMWTSLSADFPDLPVVGRGIGGTLLAELPRFAPQLVYPLRPRIIVVYAGDNDLRAGRSVDDVVAAFEAVRAQIHREAPQARIIFLSIKPSPSRLAILPAVRAANTRIAAACDREPRCTFVDVFTPMLEATGQPRAELFRPDNLHLNATGYALWTKLVAPVLHAP